MTFSGWIEKKPFELKVEIINNIFHIENKKAPLNKTQEGFKLCSNCALTKRFLM